MNSTTQKPEKVCICGRTNPGACEVRGCYFPSEPRWRKDNERKTSPLRFDLWPETGRFETEPKR